MGHFASQNRAHGLLLVSYVTDNFELSLVRIVLTHSHVHDIDIGSKYQATPAACQPQGQAPPDNQMKLFGKLLLIGMLTIPQMAHAQNSRAHIQEALLQPTEPDPTVTPSSPLIEMGITVQPAAGIPVSAYQVEILLTTSNPLFNPNAVVAATAEYTPAQTYTEAEIDTTALPAGNYWVSAELLPSSGGASAASAPLEVGGVLLSRARSGDSNRLSD